MNKLYPALFSPLKIRGKQIKNRIVSAPHSCPYMLEPSENGYFNYSEDAALYYANIARGGAAIVNTGHLGVDPRYYLGANKMYFNFFSDTLRWHQIPNMRRMTTGIHAYGALASIELNHGGDNATPVEGNEVPGPCEYTRSDGVHVRALDEDEMDLIADYFADAAEVGVKGNFDIINVHAAHHWLLGQFFSPKTNKRTDKYGGSTENRARFPRMVLERIRERVGENILIKIRFSASELTEGGYDIEEAVKLVKCLEDVIDIVQCSVGRLDNLSSEMFTFPTQYAEHGVNAYLAKRMKECVSIPVETIGGINDPAMADKLIRDGYADFVGMARTFIADPNWARKAKLGRSDDIRPCIRCIRCMDSNGSTGVGECTVNPRRIFFRQFPDELAHEKKNIAVIGGGPAGMMAANELGLKGQKVTLYEKSDKLGGRLEFADHIIFKEDIKRYREYLERQVRKNPNVEILLNSPADPDDIRNKGYDAAVVALGAQPVIPPVAGIENDNVFPAVDIYGKEDALGDTVVIIGGGQIGCETAIHLAYLGKKVHIVEMTSELMKDSKEELPDESFATEFYLSHEYSKQHKSFVGVKESDRITIHLNSTVTGISGTCAEISENGTQKAIETDSVVIAAGLRPDADMRSGYENIADEVLFIGDCKKAGNIRDTSADGYYAALRL
ncbi:MAG: FAD-binding protein [Clostridiales bacterium]|nr:FAD-binding protein [Clostridiales bacterium]